MTALDKAPATRRAATSDLDAALPRRDDIVLLHPTKGLEVYPGVFMPDAEQERRGIPRERPAARGFLVLFIALLLTQSVAVVAVNYTVNPRSDFSPAIVEPLVLNDVRIKLQSLDALGDPPRAVVLGSSRAITLPPEALEAAGHGPAFNLALSNAGPPDALAAYRYLVERQAPPAVIIVGLEIERLHGTADVQRFVARSDIGEFAERGADTRALLDDLLAAYSFAYTRDTAEALRFAVFGAPESRYTFDPDGQRHFRPYEEPDFVPAHDRDRAIQAVTGRLQERIASLPVGPPGRVEDTLSLLVAEARSAGTTVHLVFTPILPEVHVALSETAYSERHSEALEAVTDLCGPGIHVHDLTHVERFGGRSEDFYDGWHFVGPSAHRFVATTLANTWDACREVPV